MPKEKKINIKHYLDKRLSVNTPIRNNIWNDVPIYVRLTFNRITTKFPSTSYKHLIHQFNYNSDTINFNSLIDQKIEKNDARIYTLLIRDIEKKLFSENADKYAAFPIDYCKDFSRNFLAMENPFSDIKWGFALMALDKYFKEKTIDSDAIVRFQMCDIPAILQLIKYTGASSSWLDTYFAFEEIIEELKKSKQVVYFSLIDLLDDQFVSDIIEQTICQEHRIEIESILNTLIIRYVENNYV